MKTRLAIFIVTLLLLPFAGAWLAGAEWEPLPTGDANALAATSVAALATACLLLLGNLGVVWRTGNNPLQTQRRYFLTVGAASAALGWLLVYLNQYATGLSSGQHFNIAQGLFSTLLFALLAPAVLSLRAFLGTFTGMLRRLARAPALPLLADDMLIFLLSPVVIVGLLGGAAWPEILSPLFWLGPLLLLVVLQLMWQESTIFAGLKYGDWGRLVHAALAGLIVCNLAVWSYAFAGGDLTPRLPAGFNQAGYALFGLLILQLSDVIAENWRGKSRSEVFKRKPFPIPVSARK
ncbi:MAG: hypothetical protein PHW66_02675 [Gallionella sp.]|nr:hypothetical protein [Gallionella sp.]